MHLYSNQGVTKETQLRNNTPLISGIQAPDRTVPIWDEYVEQ